MTSSVVRHQLNTKNQILQQQGQDFAQLQSATGGIGEEQSALSSSESSLDSRAARCSFLLLSRPDSCHDSITLICASSVGCQFNYTYGEDFVVAKERD